MRTRRVKASDYIEEAGQFFRTGEHTRAYASYVEAARIDATNPVVWSQLGEALVSERRHRLAVPFFRKALVLNETAVAHLALANTLSSTPDIADAESHFLRSLKLDPTSSKAWYGLAYMLTMLGRIDEAFIAIKKSFDLASEPVPDITYLNSFLYFHQQNWEAAFRDYEARIVIKKPSFTPPLPRWDGEDLGDKILYVFCEQGFGDIIQFVRFLPQLPRSPIVFMVPHEMRRLLEANFAAPHIKFAVVGDEVEADYCLPLCSIPRWLTRKGDVGFSIERKPYITKINKTRVVHRPKGIRLAVGVVWAGDPKHQNDALRSSTADAFAESLSVPGVELYSLQMGRPTDPALVGEMGIMQDLTPMIRDFADTAAIVAQLDCVICVDTSVAHLCGAMGKECHVLIPYGAVDWRWTHNETTPWYSSLKLHRQQKGDSWSDVLRKVAINELS